MPEDGVVAPKLCRSLQRNLSLFMVDVPVNEKFIHIAQNE
jgi:hypothetical protein